MLGLAPSTRSAGDAEQFDKIFEDASQKMKTEEEDTAKRSEEDEEQNTRKKDNSPKKHKEVEASEALTGLVRATELQKQTAKKVIKAEAVQKQEVATPTEVQPKLKKVESKQTTETTQEAKAQAALKRQQQRTATRARNRVQEFQQLTKADQLLQAIGAVMPENDEGNDPKANLQCWQQSLQEYASYSPQIATAVELLASAAIQVEESQYELQSFLNGFDQDPNRLRCIETRLDEIYSIARKHKVHPEQLIAHTEALQAQLSLNQNQEADLQAISAQQDQLAEEYIEAAKQLTKARQQTAKQLQAAVAEQLVQLGMPHCQLEFAIKQKPQAELFANGLDEAEMLIQTNPGQPAKPLAKIASGGELSRISLAIQVVIASTSITPSLIFDEVDVGIGGATAEIVGRLLAQLGQHCQLLCITHLPQVASQAQHHLQVSKHNQNQTTHTQVVPLDDKQRVQEIARMLGGVTLTEQTLAHAKEMLGTSAVH